jgi:fumarate hydratase class II
VKDEVVQYSTKDAAQRTPIEMHYQLGVLDDAKIEHIAKVLQELLDAKHEDPMPKPVVATKNSGKQKNGTGSLAVTCNDHMHSIVRNHLRKIAVGANR